MLNNATIERNAIKSASGIPKTINNKFLYCLVKNNLINLKIKIKPIIDITTIGIIFEYKSELRKTDLGKINKGTASSHQATIINVGENK